MDRTALTLCELQVCVNLYRHSCTVKSLELLTQRGYCVVSSAEWVSGGVPPSAHIGTHCLLVGYSEQACMSLE